MILVRSGRLRTTCGLQGQSTYTSALVYAPLPTKAFPIEPTGSCSFVALFYSVVHHVLAPSLRQLSSHNFAFPTLDTGMSTLSIVVSS